KTILTGHVIKISMTVTKMHMPQQVGLIGGLGAIFCQHDSLLVCCLRSLAQHEKLRIRVTLAFQHDVVVLVGDVNGVTFHGHWVSFLCEHLKGKQLVRKEWRNETS